MAANLRVLHCHDDIHYDYYQSQGDIILRRPLLHSCDRIKLLSFLETSLETMCRPLKFPGFAGRLLLFC